MAIETRPDLRVLYGTHPGEKLADRVGALLVENPIQGISAYLAHPEAAAKGVRQIGEKQLQGCYEHGDRPEHRAARRVVDWLGYAAGRATMLVLDTHNSAIEGLDFTRIGDFSPTAAVGAALLTTEVLTGDMQRLVHREDTFSKATGGVVLELPAVKNSELESSAKKVYDQLGIVAAMSAVELAEVYQQKVDQGKLRFFRPHLMMTVALEEWMVPLTDEQLLRLETIPTRPPFEQLDAETAEYTNKVLGLKQGTGLFVGTWGYGNLSVPVPARGYTIDGRPRLQCFGEVFSECEPPTRGVDKGEDWLHWNAEPTKVA